MECDETRNEMRHTISQIRPSNLHVFDSWHIIWNMVLLIDSSFVFARISFVFARIVKIREWYANDSRYLIASLSHFLPPSLSLSRALPPSLSLPRALSRPISRALPLSRTQSHVAVRDTLAPPSNLVMIVVMSVDMLRAISLSTAAMAQVPVEQAGSHVISHALCQS